MVSKEPMKTHDSMSELNVEIYSKGAIKFQKEKKWKDEEEEDGLLVIPCLLEALFLLSLFLWEFPSQELLPLELLLSLSPFLPFATNFQAFIANLCTSYENHFHFFYYQTVLGRVHACQN